MKFKTFIEAIADTDTDINMEDLTKADLIELINELDEDEIGPVMEILLNYLENTFDVDDIDGDGTDEIDEDLDEAKYFKTKKSQVKRNKKQNKSAKRKLAKQRKRNYKKNRAKIKRYQKKARRKAKTGKTAGGKRITKHR